MVENKFALRLKEVLKEKGITRKTLAHTIGVSQASVTYWLAVAKQPTIEYVYQICKNFDVSANYLLGLDE